MTEVILATLPPQAPRYKGDEINDLKELGPEQREVVELQLADYQRLNEAELNSPLRDSLARGDTKLPEGTLVHGVGFSNEGVEGIAHYGVVSGELIGKGEYGETHYCADFFRVDHDITIQQYCADILDLEPGSSFKRRMEGEYLPSTKRANLNLMGIIIDTSIPDIQPLLEADAYKKDTEELFKGIINTLPVEKDSPRANRLAAILVGVPRGAIAGIIVGPGIAASVEALAKIKEAFQGAMPVVSVTGELLSAE